MKIFILKAEKSRLTVERRECVTSGSVNVDQVQFRFSADWDGLTRTAVFRAGNVSRSVVLDGSGLCTVPWEVLAEPGVPLLAGVRGVWGGETVLPTVWVSLGLIREGAAADGSQAGEPAPDLWQQELSGKGDSLGCTEDGELGLYAGKRLLSSVPVLREPGHGLKLEDGRLCVDAVDGFDRDNTLPITAAGVQTVVGNIDALLSAI